MAILKIARLGHPILRRPADPVPAGDLHGEEVRRLIDDMIETCRENDGAGLAAPQVHVPLRIVLMEVQGNPRYPDVPDLPLTVVVNPEVTPLTDEIQHVWDGCLSVPDLRGQVPRARRVRLRGLDRHGAPIDAIYDGFPAAVVQHECDHLDGRVYLDRMGSMQSLHFLPEFRRYAVLPPVEPGSRS